MLLPNKSIKVLKLNANKFSKLSLAKLKATISAKKNLVKLDMSGNTVWDFFDYIYALKELLTVS
jgi:hypothetical protein